MWYLSYLHKRSIPYLLPLPFSPEMGGRCAGVDRRTKQTNVASAREWDFTAQQFWWSWVFAHLIGNIADDAMQMDVQKTLYPFYTTKKMPYVTVTITEKRFVGSNSQVC